MANKTLNNALLKLLSECVNPYASAKGSVSSLSLSAGVITTVPLKAWISRSDTKFTLTSDGGIQCPYTGDVLVSGNVYIQDKTGATKGCYVVCSNGQEISQFIDSGSAGAISSGAKIIPVTAGDIIYLKARSNLASSCAPNNAATSLLVKYIGGGIA